MEICSENPNEFSSDCTTAIAELIKSGGALPARTNTLKARIRRARLLAVCYKNGLVTAVAALKNPDPAYREDVFAKANVPIAQFQNAPELGYLTVTETMRGKGIGKDLARALLQDLREPCYATTDSDVMKKILQSVDFSQEGDEWEGQRGTLSLWTWTP